MLKEGRSEERNDEVIYFTQQELAKRWRVSEATIKKIRDNGGIPYFLPPNSSRVLYPRDEIIIVEQSKLNLTKKEGPRLKRHSEIKMKKPAVSSTSERKWEI